MAKRSRPRIVTKDRLDLEAFPEHVQVALAEVAGAAREGVLALSVACGFQVVAEMMAADVERICGPKGKHDGDRVAYRHGTEARQLPLGGALVKTDRPRARTTDGGEVALPTWEAFSARDLLGEIALGRMLAVFIDGMHVGEHLIVVALGVDAAGGKHPLGLWEGTTENAAVCRSLVGSLIDRGLPEDRAMLFVTDGGKAIATVIRKTWGQLALHQRCRNHKLENITSHLPERERTFIARKVRAAWSNPDAEE